jgi:hypothetical protein
MTTTTAAARSTGPTRARRVRLAWVLILSGALVALLIGAAAFMAARMNSLPANLDFSTTRLSEAGLFRASYSTESASLPVNQMHTWRLRVETAGGQPVTDAVIGVDGDMPQHGHGMPTRPQVTRNLGHGEYLVEGMKFQMGGWWVIDFDISTAGQTDRVSFNLMLSR